MILYKRFFPRTNVCWRIYFRDIFDIPYERKYESFSVMYPRWYLCLFHNLSSSYSIPHTCEQRTLVFQGMRGISNRASLYPRIIFLRFRNHAVFSHHIKVEAMQIQHNKVYSSHCQTQHVFYFSNLTGWQYSAIYVHIIVYNLY